VPFGKIAIPVGPYVPGAAGVGVGAGIPASSVAPASLPVPASSVAMPPSGGALSSLHSTGQTGDVPASTSSMTSFVFTTFFDAMILPVGKSMSAIRSHDGNVTSAGQDVVWEHRLASPLRPAMLRGRNTASYGAARRKVPSPRSGRTSCRPCPGGSATVTVGLLYCAASVGASSVDGSTSVKSHEPRFALTRRQPSVLEEICSGSEPSGTRPKPAVDLFRSTSFQLSASITVRSPLALLGTNAKVRLCTVGIG